MNDPLVGRVLAERFEIIERIGEGGTGVVYKAKQLSVDRIIAIKVLGAHVSTDPSWVKRFHLEARAASRLQHPNTVSLIDFGQTKEGLLFIAMEYLHGRSLRSELDRVRKLPANRAMRILSQVCSSLTEAHTQGIIHRDIKPDNIYLVDMKGSEDFVKVLDFSVAKLDSPDAQVTRAGVVFGTPAYMSPEQGRGVQLDARSDVYAVGVVAYEMLQGRPPFDHKIPTEVVMMHLRDQPPPLEGVPPAVEQLVMKALQKEPARRQQNAEAMEAECHVAASQLGGVRTPSSGMRQSTPMAAPVSAPAPRSAVADQRTMMAPAVQTPPPQRQSQGSTVMLDANGNAPPANATMMLPDSAGVIAFAEAAAVRAREGVAIASAPPASGMFWAAWVVLGVALGLVAHFFLLKPPTP